MRTLYPLLPSAWKMLRCDRLHNPRGAYGVLKGLWRVWALLLGFILYPSTFNTVSAQGETDAFYIYQNDGHFNGFFYDQVKRIAYSKLDTLGIEYDEYVSQEIVTEDSTYRIMLTAIDSVSFVQPEIKFAPKVRFMRDEGMLEYYVTCLDMNLAFDNSMPTSLRPRVGDVLVCPDLEGYVDENDEPAPYVAKVVEVKEEMGFVTVYCDYVESLSDVFGQFITVEEVKNVVNSEGASVRRRIAGMKQPKRIEGNYNDITLFNLSTGLEWKVNLYGKLTFGFNANIGFGMTASAVYNISWTDFYIKTELKEQLATGFTILLDGELYNDASLSNLPGVGALISRFSKIPFPASFPILYAHVMPEPFTRAEAHLNLNLSTGVSVKSLTQSIEIKSEYPYVSVRGGYLPAPFLPLSFEPEANWSLSAQLNGMVQSGLKFPIKVGTQDWIKKLTHLEVGATIFTGPKVTGELDYEFIHGNLDDGLYKVDKGMYESMKGSKVDLSLMSIDLEFATEGSILNHKTEWKKTTSSQFLNYTLHLFPEIEDAEYDIIGNEMNTVTGKYSTSGDVFLPQKLGIALYSKKDADDKDYSNLYRYVLCDELYFLNTFNSVDLKIEGVEPGEYMVRPFILHTFGKIPVLGEEQLITIAPQEVELKPSVIQAEEEGGDFEVELLTSLDMPITPYPNDDWITAEVQKGSGTQSSVLKVHVAENTTDKFRTGTVLVRQRLSTTKTVERTLTVKQYGGLQLSASKVEFTPDGGEQTIDILTSYKPITINLGGADSWLSYDLDDRRLVLTATPNSGTNRTATVVVAAWNEKAQGISTVKLTVTQKGIVDASIEPESLQFQANGGTQRVNVTLGQGSSFIGVDVPKSSQDWILVETRDNYFNVTAMPNTLTEEREALLRCGFRGKAPDGSDYPAVVLLRVTQAAGTVSVEPKQLSFTAEGGEQKLTINYGVYPYYGASVSETDAAWLHVSVGDAGVVTVKADANPFETERAAVISCFASGVPNPKDDEVISVDVPVSQEAGKAEEIVPDPDNSPFELINFWLSAKVETPGDDGEMVVNEAGMAFNFKADNSSFTKKTEGDVTHVTARGHAYVTDLTGDNTANLTFDIDNKEKKVKNLRFTFSGITKMQITVPGFGTAYATNYSTSTVTLGDFPLSTFTNGYKEGKVTVGEGLRVTGFTMQTRTHATYSDPEIEPLNYTTVSYYLDSPDNFVWLIIDEKEEIALEWPSAAVMNSLKNSGMPVYEGSTPSSVEGTFLISPVSLVSDPTGFGEQATDGLDGVVIRLSEQQNGTINYSAYEIYDGAAYPADSPKPALIMGDGNQFTICVPMGEGMAILLSGEHNNGNISNLYYAMAAMDNVGEHIIMKDSDSTAKATTWSPGSYDYDVKAFGKGSLGKRLIRSRQQPRR